MDKKVSLLRILILLGIILGPFIIAFFTAHWWAPIIFPPLEPTPQVHEEGVEVHAFQ